MQQRRSLALKVASALGLRPIAEQLDVPHTTLRAWWQRFRARSPTLLAQCTALAASLDGTAVVLEAVGERAAVESLSVAWQRAEARFGEHIGGVWSFWSRISGGQALGTHTTSPWAPGAGAVGWRHPKCEVHLHDRKAKRAPKSTNSRRRRPN